MDRGEALHERMLRRAGDLFYSEGITTTGVDRLAEVVGVSKRTLYKHFGDKDHLVVEYLRSRDEPTRAAFAAGAATAGDDPAAQLVALFEGSTDRLLAPGFRGCPYVNAVGELGPDHPARAVAAAHKRAMHDWLRDRAASAGAADPDGLATQLAVLLDGAMAQRAVLGDAFDPAAVTAAATILISAATSGSATGSPAP